MMVPRIVPVSTLEWRNVEINSMHHSIVHGAK